MHWYSTYDTSSSSTLLGCASINIGIKLKVKHR